jgi:hypothetical protein
LEVKKVAAYEFHASSSQYLDIGRGYTPLTLDPVDDTLRLSLQLPAKLFDVAIHHYLIDLKTAGGRVEIEKAPTDLPLRQTIVRVGNPITSDSYTAGLAVVKLIRS